LRIRRLGVRFPLSAPLLTRRSFRTAGFLSAGDHARGLARLRPWPAPVSGEQRLCLARFARSASMRPAMPSFRVLPFLFVLALPLAATVAPGTRIDTLPAGKHTYTDVTVRSVNAVTVVILHSGGLASVPLRDLSPEWQQRFNYNPQAEADALAAKPVRPPALPAPPAAPASPVRHSPSTPVENLLASLGSPPVPRPLVDLRPRFFDFKLHAKDQGRRPSC